MSKLSDMQAISANLEADFLRSFTRQAEDCLQQLNSDSVSPGRIAQIQDALAEIRDQGLARIRTSVILAMAAHESRLTK